MSSPSRWIIGYLPSLIRPRVVRADSGFVCRLAGFVGAVGLRYIVVARLLQPLQRLLRRDLIWTPSEVPGPDMPRVAPEINWPGRDG